MTSHDAPLALVERLAALGTGPKRHIAALVGAPGSGKSTLSDALLTALEARGIDCAILPMDGFHYDDAILSTRNLLPRKGAPDTFDIAGFSHLLSRLRANAEPEIAVPVFDRALELSRNAARVIPQRVRLLLVEGNYLLLDRPAWRDLSAQFDLTVMLEVPEAELQRRLYQRWRDHGVPEAEIPARVEANDMRNGLTVLQKSLSADLTLTADDLCPASQPKP